MTGPKPGYETLQSGHIGLYSACNFYLTYGKQAARADLAQALCYFADELIALPRATLPEDGLALPLPARQDNAGSAQIYASPWQLAYPPLVWIGSPQIIRSARLAPGGERLETNQHSWAFSVVPKIALNRSYYNTASAAFLSGRTLTLRGTISDGSFTARTIWPEDFRLDPAAPQSLLDANAGAFRRLVRGEPRGGAQSPMAATTLWERNPGATRRWTGRPIVAVVLNGAQGDDDEAHGGHFALITGRLGDNGEIGDLLVNNFYTLDAFSEKGIIAAPVTLDAYLADLNSGQAWYRPSYLMVALLASDGIANRLQGALGRVHDQLYRHQLAYRHASMNCAGISVDVLRTLGWNVPARGRTSRWLALVAFPYFAIRERSVAKAIGACDYLAADRTRLFPAAAFEEIGVDLLHLARGTVPRRMTVFEAKLAADIEALVFLRLPQIPSSRPWGDFPVNSIAEYRARMPSDPAKAKVVPVPPRALPEVLRGGDLPPSPVTAGEWIALAWMLASVVGIPWLLRLIWRRRQAKDGA